MSEIVYRTLCVGSFVHEVHLLRQVFPHLFSEPREFKIGEPVLDPSCPRPVKRIPENHENPITDQVIPQPSPCQCRRTLGGEDVGAEQAV